MAHPYDKVIQIIRRIKRGSCYYGDCCVWLGSKDASGHGRIKIFGKVKFVHRVVYSLLVCKIPYGNVVRHDCDNPSCCTANHLRLGTRADNYRDMFDDHRNNGITRTSLNLDIAIRICMVIGKMVDGEEKNRRIDEISIKYSVSSNHICSMCDGTCWDDPLPPEFTDDDFLGYDEVGVNFDDVPF